MAPLTPYPLTPHPLPALSGRAPARAAAATGPRPVAAAMPVRPHPALGRDADSRAGPPGFGGRAGPPEAVAAGAYRSAARLTAVRWPPGAWLDLLA